ncbi:2-C-methyl-D-erythritol 4-phosphate cytidylyltransferase [Neisseria sp. ZJ106]|uniref:2-C-methyl-D-erythritol 4-phosphate cytidylyltransferase n=1 Tax=Neisseria lisongii TaxID=2912188 RepID=A0ABY7RKP5_9NEIS|nr:2-C-methyl-D-erythritol 4-phosphate cytidylyltransferase [Neisseria lisongii]MCF7521705.1 2-C-methyl-D-erythritol 4-phosphate cytidylyltransferase [Neisseria lisongii]WCL72212.1 2-C-methyl-D-erythritol 4-phosphate cytidylyltransferase [Neisseria lisongii]
MNHRQNIVLIPAAGSGSRFGAAKPKQYIEINGKTVLQHTVDIFERQPQIARIAVIVSPDCAAEFARFQTASAKTQIFAVGGDTRAQTVKNGVDTLLAQGLAQPDDNILVHDAARCCLPPEALQRLLATAADRPEGGILAVPVADTLKRGQSGAIAATVDRSGLWQAQTPQLFRAALLQQALSVSDLNGITDEASAVEKLGVRPLLVAGDIRNLKLTLPQDEYLVRLLLNAAEQVV